MLFGVIKATIEPVKGRQEEDDDMQIGEIGKGIAEKRKQAGLSQEELAKRLGLTRQAISRWESGAALPTVDNLVELARVLGVSVDELLQLTREEKQAGLSAESVGLLLDEQAGRQEKRMKRLTWALAAAAGVLVLGIVVSALISNRQVRRLESSMQNRIGSLNAEVSQMSNRISSEVAGAVEDALASGRSELADKGERGMEYVPKTQTVNVQVFAYPIKLEEQTGAQFYAVCSGEKITVPATQVESGFEATLPIPVSEDTDYFSADVYLIWTQDGQTLTEKVCSVLRYMDEIRPRIDIIWPGVRNTMTRSEFQAECTVRIPEEDRWYTDLREGVQAVSLELSILYQGEVKAKKTIRGGDEWYRLDSFTESIEWSPDELIEDWENVVLHAVMTDAKGNTYTKDGSVASSLGSP